MSSTFNAEEADNLEEIEKQFAVKAVMQAETYWGLLSKIPGSRLKLTQLDEEIFTTLIEDFPEYATPEGVSEIKENDMKSPAGKIRWRAFCNKFEGKVDDFNFGTLLRSSSKSEYDQEGTIFAVRMQFYAIEIARNKFGLNDWISQL